MDQIESSEDSNDVSDEEDSQRGEWDDFDDGQYRSGSRKTTSPHQSSRGQLLQGKSPGTHSRGESSRVGTTTYKSVGSRGVLGGSGGTRNNTENVGGATHSTSSSKAGAYHIPTVLDVGHQERAVRLLTMLARNVCTFWERQDLLLQAHYFVSKIAKTIAETGNIGKSFCRYERAKSNNFNDAENVQSNNISQAMTFNEWVAMETETGVLAEEAFLAPNCLAEWEKWRERMVIGPATIDKVPLLVHHLLSLSDMMESHGLGAHAIAPLALCEVVIRFCLSPDPSLLLNNSQGSMIHKKSSSFTSKPGPPSSSKTSTSPQPAGGGEDGRHRMRVGECNEKEGTAGAIPPVLQLVCMRRSRLLFALGPGTQGAGVEAFNAAGSLGLTE
ncbi:unnamed protein product, partial [Choristocarpus tenellus]